jgi:hypothetical protein
MPAVAYPIIYNGEKKQKKYIFYDWKPTLMLEPI